MAASQALRSALGTRLAATPSPLSAPRSSSRVPVLASSRPERSASRRVLRFQKQHLALPLLTAPLLSASSPAIAEEFLVKSTVIPSPFATPDVVTAPAKPAKVETPAVAPEPEAPEVQTTAAEVVEVETTPAAVPEVEAVEIEPPSASSEVAEAPSTEAVAYDTAPTELQVVEVQLPDVEIPADLSSLDDSSALLAAGAALTVALAFGAVSLLFRKGYAGDISPEDALVSVEGGKAVLLDVRPSKERREDGSPLVKSSAKGVTPIVAVPFLRGLGGDEFEIDEQFVANVTGKELEGTIIAVDSSGSQEIAVGAAKALTSAGSKSVKVMRGGSDAWKEAGLAWREPILSLPSLPSVSLNQEVIGESLKAVSANVSAAAQEAQKGLPGALAAVAAAGAAVALVAEAEAVMQLVASLTAGQFLVKKFLFKKDRDETIAQLKALVTREGERAKERTSTSEKDVKVEKVEKALPEAATAAPAAAPPAAAAAPAAAAPANGAVAASAPAPVKPDPSLKPTPPPVPSEPQTPAPPLSPVKAELPAPPTEAPAALEPKIPAGAAEQSPTTTAEEEKETVQAPAAPSTPLPSGKSTDLPYANRPLSPFTMYADLKPPSSPTPAKPVASSAGTLEVSAPAASSAQAQEISAPAAAAPASNPEAPVEKSTTLPYANRPLSPYSMYPDLKPPSSPAPKAASSSIPPAEASVTEADVETFPAQASSFKESPAAPLSTPPSASDLASDSSKPTSTDLPPSTRPLSPYATYPDLKPPSSPAPAAPVEKV